ncbi:NADH-quinone oxidoreductase subunit M [Chryseolinea sp. T2]|uniref:complex I subunit 4 family protein n=1 Tax=Chryseolinea sp. T2 TaxID=3129255 RepID=UPI003076B5DD
MQEIQLSLLIFTPLLAASIGLLIPAVNSGLFRYLSLVANLIQIAVIASVLSLFKSGDGIQFVEYQSWITIDLGTWGTLRAAYFLGVDGLSLPLVALSVAILLIATISSWNVKRQTKGYFLLLLLLNAAIIGSFTALDFLLFYLFFEFMLLPMFFLIALWGGPRREYASIKFFLYTLVGSIFILVAMIALYISVQEPMGSQQIVHSFNLVNMRDWSNYLPGSVLEPGNARLIGIFDARQWCFLLLFLGFGIKLPMVPVHTWLPDAHVEASTPVSVLLAALLLKIGGYGLLRIAFPLFPDAAAYFGSFVGWVGVVSIIYGGLNAMSSKDLKRMIAYSSVSHMGFVLIGMASLTPEGVSGSVYQMFSHGILSAMLFLLAGVVYDRTHDRTIDHYSGLYKKMPVYSTFVLIAFFASMGLPGFAGFIGEILVFLGAFKSNSAGGPLHESLAIISTVGLVVSAVYFLWTLQRMFFGPFFVKGEIQADDLTDLRSHEYLVLLPLATAALFFGIIPQPLVNVIEPFAKDFTTFILNAGTSIHSTH